VNHEDFLEFLRNVGALKRIPRTGWVQAGIKEPESVADHSFRTTLLSMVLSDQMGLDTEKVVRMALIHDLAESMTGDLTPSQKPVDHGENESDAMAGILSLLPRGLGARYMGLWEEYEEQKTPEARLVHNADRIEMLVQALEYKDGSVNLDQFWGTHVDAEYKEIIDLLKKKRKDSPYTKG
jgi:putative hydrolase of HD superfamily